MLSANVGEQWNTREGKIVTVISNISGHASHPILVMDETKKLYSLDNSGRFIGDGYAHNMDIVSIHK